MFRVIEKSFKFRPTNWLKMLKKSWKTHLKTQCFLASIFMDFGLDFGMPKRYICGSALGFFSILLPRSAQEFPKRLKGAAKTRLRASKTSPCWLFWAPDALPKPIFGFRNRFWGSLHQLFWPKLLFIASKLKFWWILLKFSSIFRPVLLLIMYFPMNPNYKSQKWLPLTC